MKLQINGATWHKHVLLYTAGIYYAKKLGYWTRKRIKIELSLIPSMRAKHHYRGAAWQASRNLFYIHLDAGLKPISLLRCLAHEMIHVKQWISGKMKDLNGQRFRVQWGKRLYRPEKLAYDKHPWEIQAHRLEKILYKSFTLAWDAR